MKTSKRKLGDKGEEAAQEYLESLGQTVLERNWTSGHLEVDIITLDEGGLHFVEVKSRTAPISAQPQENITSLKQQRLCRAARKYVSTCAGGRFGGDVEILFDVVTVIFNEGEMEIEYYPQAFIPIYV